MNYTENFNLNLPETTDQFRVDHQNENMRKIDEELIRNASQMEAGRMTAEDKKKLDGIDAGANNTVVDSELSTESENPVQNKVIANELENIKSDVSTTYLTKTEGEEIKKSVSDGKSKVAGSITTMGVETSASATFDTMAANILAIESGIAIGCEPITDFSYSMYLSKATFTWVLPDDYERGGIEIWTKEGESNFGDTPTGTKIYDSDTFFGTDVTTCDYEYEKGNTDYYTTIYTYTYINNERQYVKGKTILVTTGIKKGFEKFTTSGTFTVPAGVTSIDVFCVCGGYSGKRGGSGGNGGRVATKYGISVTQGQQFAVTIGAGGVHSVGEFSSNAGGNTTFGDLISNYTSSTGTGGTCGYASAYSNTPGGRGGEGQYAFGDETLDGIRYSAGGGGGGYYNYSGYSASPGSGGVTGGGSGGSGTGGYATANTGSGGGGGRGYNGPSDSPYDGGDGGSGICIVRWGY